jgi:hypothetical protein
MTIELIDHVRWIGDIPNNRLQGGAAKRRRCRVISGSKTAYAAVVMIGLTVSKISNSSLGTLGVIIQGLKQLSISFDWHRMPTKARKATTVEGGAIFSSMFEALCSKSLQGKKEVKSEKRDDVLYPYFPTLVLHLASIVLILSCSLT